MFFLVFYDKMLTAPNHSDIFRTFITQLFNLVWKMM